MSTLPGCLAACFPRQELANLRGALLRDLRVEKLVPPLRKELEKWREEVRCFLEERRFTGFLRLKGNDPTENGYR